MSAGFCVFNIIIALISVLTSNLVKMFFLFFFFRSALCWLKGSCKSIKVFDFCSLVYFKSKMNGL